jgi:uncharacterized protein YjiS (DUF1127 family)
MSAHTADSQFSFRLPSLSYVDASWEEPDLRAAAAQPSIARKAGLRAWLAARAAAFRTWQRDNQAAGELGMMTDRELMDIGISRSDLNRVFDPALSADLGQRGA